MDPAGSLSFGAAAPAHRQLLQERFGLPDFRGRQYEVIARLLQGRDVLALLPTGSGKSLCYQFPALLGQQLTLVVSPLIALMRDQERRLQQLGIDGRALCSGQTREERQAILARLPEPGFKVLLASPERIMSTGFLNRLGEALGGRRKVGLLVIDEAHCVAEWGAQFRPVYRRLGELRRWFPSAPLLAMTASADAGVRADLLRILGMPSDATVLAGFDRPELFYRVACTSTPARTALAFLQHHHPGASAILYCRRRWQTQVMARYLCANGIAAQPYHAGLAADRRAHAESWFLRTQGAVMAATIAFGMGIDKPDVRLVVHLGPSASMAAYYQESGRAGRDGRPADVLLLVPRQPPAGPVADAAPRSAHAGDAMQAYLETRGCRRAALLAALDETLQAPCAGCDRCRPDWHPPPLSRETRAPWVPHPGEGSRPHARAAR